MIAMSTTSAYDKYRRAGARAAGGAGVGGVGPGGTRLDAPTGMALAGSGVAALATALGALPALFIRTISARREDIMLGFGAMMMLDTALG